MKQLGNLANVCAKRMDVLLQIYDGYASVHVGEGPERASMVAKWDDDKAIGGFVHELNYGKYAKEERMIQNERIIGKAARADCSAQCVPRRVLQQKCSIGIGRCV